MNIGNSIVALRVQNNIERLDNQITKQTEKLSSGIRINRASDDAAGLNISEKMRSQIRGLDMSIDNATDGISMIQTAEGGLQQISDLLQRMNELSIKAVNGINTAEDLEKISIEYDQLKNEIDRIAETTTFNGKKLLNVTTGETKLVEGMKKVSTSVNTARTTATIDFSTVGDGNEFIIKKDDQEYRFTFSYGNETSIRDGNIKVSFTGKETNEEKAEKLAEAIEDNVSDVVVGVRSVVPKDEKNYLFTITGTDYPPTAGQVIDISMETNAPIIKVGNSFDDVIFLNFKSATTTSLGVDSTSLKTMEDAKEATKKIQQAISDVSEIRGNLGATQNRLEYAINRITIEKENTEASESRIRDLDMAKEMVTNAKTRIIQQTSLSMLAQANQSGGSVLVLLTENSY